MDEAAYQLAERLASACAEAVHESGGGPSVIAAYVHGSLVLPDAFEPGRSDIDLLVITDSPLDDQHGAALAWAIHAVADASPSRFDVRVVSRQTAARPIREPIVEFYAERHGSGTIESGSRVPEPDLLIEFSFVSRHGRPIIGSSPPELVSEPPAAWILDHGDGVFRRWQGLVDDDAHAELMVLTACRI